MTTALTDQELARIAPLADHGALAHYLSMLGQAAFGMTEFPAAAVALLITTIPNMLAAAEEQGFERGQKSAAAEESYPDRNVMCANSKCATTAYLYDLTSMPHGWTRYDHVQSFSGDTGTAYFCPLHAATSRLL